MSEWIKVTDRLPDSRYVWVWRPLVRCTDVAFLGYAGAQKGKWIDHSNDERFRDRYVYDDVSHWREIEPAPHGPAMTEEEYEALIIEVKARIKERP